MPKSKTALLILPLLLGAAAALRAEPLAPLEPERANGGARYLFGAALLNQPDYAGSDQRQFKLRPLWAVQWGRFRISTSRAGGLMGIGEDDARGPGASADLLSGERFRLGLALRYDNGRRSADSSHLAGLPDVERTLRGRLYGSYALSRQWSLSANLSQDLLGRQGGAASSVDLGYQGRLGEHSKWGAGLGLSLGDHRYMQTYFGISPEAAEHSSLPAFQPGRGLRDLHAGVGMTSALDRHWVAFGGLGLSYLLADAAASPLTQSRGSANLSLGLAYRWPP